MFAFLRSPSILTRLRVTLPLTTISRTIASCTCQVCSQMARKPSNFGKKWQSGSFRCRRSTSFASNSTQLTGWVLSSKALFKSSDRCIQSGGEYPSPHESQDLHIRPPQSLNILGAFIYLTCLRGETEHPSFRLRDSEEVEDSQLSAIPINVVAEHRT